MRPFLAVFLVVAMPWLAGCAPVVIGAAGAVVADEILEQEQGGDGLF